MLAHIRIYVRIDEWNHLSCVADTHRRSPSFLGENLIITDFLSVFSTAIALVQDYALIVHTVGL